MHIFLGFESYMVISLGNLTLHMFFSCPIIQLHFCTYYQSSADPSYNHKPVLQIFVCFVLIRSSLGLVTRVETELGK